MALAGALPSRPSELARVEDRITFVYLEHAVIARDANALTATGEFGVTHIPSAGLLVLLLGPGTNVTHQAMTVLADSGAAIAWVGEQGVRYYAGGRPLARSTRWLERQARIVSNTRRRMAVARRMYSMRFPDEDVSRLSLQQLRGREGARVRNVYRDQAKLSGVAWKRRDYEAENFDASDAINQALSAANACLYGVVHAAVVALGCSPGLGVVHTGHDRSFVYDIADLYKAETSIPAAFESVAVAKSGEQEVSGSELSSIVRRRMRDAFAELKIVDRIVADVKALLAEEPAESADAGGAEGGGSGAASEISALEETEGRNLLWDGHGNVVGGANFGEPAEEEAWS